MIASRSRAGAWLAPAAIVVTGSAAYVALGRAVSAVPPAGIDAAARGVTGECPALAWILTASCLWPTLTVLGTIGCLFALGSPAWRARIAVAILITPVGWGASNILKDIFARPRPVYWIVHRETTYAYSSGHAMFAVLVYGLWAYHVARSSLPLWVRVPLATGLGVWAAGVIWSRLALGAHYPTDLIGGVILASVLLAAASLVARAIAPAARIW